MPTIAHITQDRVKSLAGLKLPAESQVRTRPIPMSEEEVREVRQRTGSAPYLEKKLVPVSKGRPRSQTRRKK